MRMHRIAGEHDADGAQKRTRTSTVLPPLGPEPSRQPRLSAIKSKKNQLVRKTVYPQKRFLSYLRPFGGEFGDFQEKK